MTNLTRFHYIFALLITPRGCETRLKNLHEMFEAFAKSDLAHNLVDYIDNEIV
jgi:hypothetical protein